MYQKFIEDANKIKTQRQTVNIDFFNNPSVNMTAFRERLDNIGTMDDKVLYDIVKESYKSILKDIFDRKDTSYLEVFTTPKFITVLTQVLNSVELTYNECITCNKLAYDYFTLENNDPYIKELLFILSKMVNKVKIQGLLTLGLPENLATYLAVARFSNDKEPINVKRLNFIISTSAASLMNTQMIVYIYEKLFDNVGVLIETTMFDVYNDEEEWVTEEIMEVYANISYAVMVILNNLPSVSIIKILKSYTDDFEMMYGGNSKMVRCSMKAISQDFTRITVIVEQLEHEGVYVP